VNESAGKVKEDLEVKNAVSLKVIGIGRKNCITQIL
jgi:hypothetical protein